MKPVRECAYVHNEDVDPERHVDAGPINAAVEAAVRRGRAALEGPSGVYTDFQRQVIQTVYSSMLSTHGLVRQVLASGWQNPQSIDALALARLPLEGLYTLGLMFEDPSWVEVYLRDGWKKQYIRLLLECEETRNLPRFRDFCANSVPRNLGALRELHGITDAQVATIEHDELGTPLPAGMKRSGIERFPSPAGVIDRLANGTTKRRMLERLHREYIFLCTFAHGLPDALVLKTMFSAERPIGAHVEDEELRETFHRQVEQPAYTLSLISLLQGAAELTTLYPGDVDLTATVVEAWDAPLRHFLLAKAIWNTRTKALLGVVDTAQ